MPTSDKEKRKGYTRALRRRKMEAKWAYMIARGGCRRCGETDPVVLQLHHRDPEKKHSRLRRTKDSYPMSFRTLSWGDLFEEMEKCDVLCANCHLREEAENR